MSRYYVQATYQLAGMHELDINDLIMAIDT